MLGSSPTRRPLWWERGSVSTTAGASIHVELRDGSHFVAQSITPRSLVLQTGFGHVEVPFSQISELKATDDSTHTVLTFVNGDRLSGKLSESSLEFQIASGKASVQLSGIRRLSGTSVRLEINNGLVAYFPFEGDTQDASGNNNHARRNGCVEFVTGVSGKALKLHGIDKPGFLEVSDSPSLRFRDAASIAFWLRVDGEAGQTNENCSGQKVAHATQAVLAKSCDRLGFAVHASFRPDQRQIGLLAHIHSPSSAAALYNVDQSLADWHHVAFVTGKTGTKVYFDAKLVSSADSPVNLATADNEPMVIGIQGGKGSCLPSWYPLNGQLDELRIYNRALSSEEIAELRSMTQLASRVVVQPVAKSE